MPLDHDGKIRMDCSSPYAMAGLIGLKDRFDIAFGNDTDADRHGIVTPSTGLMNPNHYLAVAIDYLFRNRPRWRADAAIGKTLVSSSLIDRVARRLGRRLAEVPVGFKWFVGGLRDGTLGFGGEESAGASFLRRDGSVWTTDKDGIVPGAARRRDHGAPRAGPGRALPELTKELRRARLRAHRRARHARAEADPEEALARRGPRHDAGGRSHPREADEGAGNGGRDRRPQGHHGQRLVRRAALGDGGRLQDLRGELPRRGAPAAASRTRRGDRQRRAGPGLTGCARPPSWPAGAPGGWAAR